MAEKEHATEEQAAPKKSKMPIIIVAVLLVLILIIGGVAAFLMMKGGDEGGAEGNQTSSHEEKSAHKEKKSHGDEHATEVGPMYPMTTFIVNLMSDSGQRYLKTTLSLELDNPEMTEEVEKQKDRIRDTILNILTSKTVEEVTTAKGKEDLKNEMVEKINEGLKDGEIRNVYFTEFVIQ